MIITNYYSWFMHVSVSQVFNTYYLFHFFLVAIVTCTNRAFSFNKVLRFQNHYVKWCYILYSWTKFQLLQVHYSQLTSFSVFPYALKWFFIVHYLGFWKKEGKHFLEMCSLYSSFVYLYLASGTPSYLRMSLFL